MNSIKEQREALLKQLDIPAKLGRSRTALQVLCLHEDTYYDYMEDMYLCKECGKTWYGERYK